MSNGILIFAQNSDCNYVKQAYLAALTAKDLVSVVVSEDVPEEYVSAFDKIIKLDQDDAANSQWKIENRYKAYQLTPYKGTLVLDSDVLVLDSIPWNKLQGKDLYFTSNPLTFRGKKFNDSYYRKTFKENNLPNVYAGCYYFEKTAISKQFFELLEIVIKNWEEFYQKRLPNKTPKHVSIDVCSAIVCDIMNIAMDDDVINFVHMKIKGQGIIDHKETWQSTLLVSYNQGLKIGNYKQSGIFHYVEKDFCDNILGKIKCTI